MNLIRLVPHRKTDDGHSVGLCRTNDVVHLLRMQRDLGSSFSMQWTTAEAGAHAPRSFSVGSVRHRESRVNIEYHDQ